MAEATGRTNDPDQDATRVPPHDLRAEQAVLGAMLVNDHAVADVVERLEVGDFYSETDRVCYEAMLALRNLDKKIDAISVTDELKRLDEYDKLGGRRFIFELVESVPVAANADLYADLVRQKAILRQVIDVGALMMVEAFREPDDAIASWSSHDVRREGHEETTYPGDGHEAYEREVVNTEKEDSGGEAQ